MKSLVVAIALSSTLVVSSCATNNNTQNGAAIGAVVGALLGKATGDNDKSRYVWGAAVGALAGSAIGSYMDKQEAELNKELAGSGVEVIRNGNNIDLILPGDITFASNSASVSGQFTPELKAVAKVLNEYNQTVLMIKGHTDSDGTEQYNQALSERRADAVKSVLVINNVNPNRVSTVGMGEYQPKASNATFSGKQQNRRVELTIQPVT